jgi:type I restriction enzyme S subunit
MGLTRLGALISRSNVRNDGGEYGIDDVRGMSVEKKFIPTKADMRGVSLRPYKVVRPKWFSYVTVTSRNSGKLTLAYNDSGKTYLVSGTYEVFSVANENQLDPRYLFLLINRGEFDRLARFNSWGSARETLSWEDFCDVELDLPPIEIQRKYAAIYESMLTNQRSYEQGLDDLSISCALLLDKCKKASRWEPIGNFLREIDLRNRDGICERAHGVNLANQFVESKASSDDLRKYKLVEPGQLACNLLHVGRDGAYPIAINDSDEVRAVSPAYAVFEPDDSAASYYLLAWLSRDEVGRYGWFICDDSIRGSMSVARFLSQKVPVPDRKLMEAAAELSVAFRNRHAINERLKSQLKEITPVLIRGSIEEASR